jgi:hypothetical protein
VETAPERADGFAVNLVEFEVARGYRGVEGERVVLRTNVMGSACGYPFEAGRDYLVFAQPDQNGNLTTSSCSRTHEVDSAGEDPDIQWLAGSAGAPSGASVFGHIESVRWRPDGTYEQRDLSGIKVTIKGPESRTAASNAEGRFRVEGLGRGPYVISAVAPRGYSAFADSQVTLHDKGCAEVDWSTAPDGHIRGHVTYYDGRAAARVSLTAKSERSSRYAQAEADGSFDFGQVAEGSYIVAVNLDFPAPNGELYYRRAFYPGTTDQNAAAVFTVGLGQIIDDLRFVLPPDLKPPSVRLQVSVLGTNSAPAADTQVLAYDDIWGANSVAPLSSMTDAAGKATFLLRPDAHYDLTAVRSAANGAQVCAAPVAVDAREGRKPVVLVLRHPFGNCFQVNKPGI